MKPCIRTLLDSIHEDTARRLNLSFSSIAGLIYLYLLLNLQALSPVIIVAAAAVAIASDFSTVYFVHSGVLSGTLERVMTGQQADRFMKLHLWPGLIGYLFLAGFLISLFLQPVYTLYYIFLAAWLIMYTSGLYAYNKLH